MKIFYLIRSLRRGGAERQLVELVKGLDKTKFSISIATFYGGNEFSQNLVEAGIKVVNLQKRGRWHNISFLINLLKIIQEISPDVIHSYLPVTNTFALIAGRLLRIKVIWGLRASYINFNNYDWTAAWIFRIEAWLSYWTDLIIVNSEAGHKYFVAHDYSERKMVVIPNGIDTAHFVPNPDARKSVREELQIPQNTPLIGFVSRFDPQKDHQTFIKGAGILHRTRGDVHFVLCGHKISWDNPNFTDWLSREKIDAHFHLLGPRTDMTRITAAFDIATLLSYGEGFPNVLGEAMSCGVPCVSTDVGDARLIIGETGKIIPIENPYELANAWAELLLDTKDLKVRSKGWTTRKRIKAKYSVEVMVERTSTQYMKLLREQ